MKSVLIVLSIFNIFLLTKILIAQNNAIIADHSVVAKYMDIPEEYIDSVKTMFLCYPGESHSRALMYGLEDLELLDSRFTVNVKWTGEPEAPTTEYLRAGKMYRGPLNLKWGSSCGEEEFFTSDEAVNMMLNHLDYCSNVLKNPVKAFCFGWCWDMNREADPDENGWAGRLYWPINRSNYTDHWDTTTTSPCLQNFIDAVNSYNSSYPESITLFSTGPVDGRGNTGANGYQRWLKNEFIRKSARNSPEISYVFDYADILCWNDDDIKNTATYNEFEYIHIQDDNAGNYDGGMGACHISRAGCLRLGKAMWWLLARIAGWSGINDISLPITLCLFKAEPITGGISLSWITESELNNEGFNLYRRNKEDAAEWQLLTLSMIPGQGNTGEKTEYNYIDRSVQKGVNYEYMLESASYAGLRIKEKVIEIVVPKPSEFAVLGNYPNPFNPKTQIGFRLPKTSEVFILIYSIQGNIVRKLALNQSFEAGDHFITWDATDNVGQSVASGMYLYLISTDEFKKTGKMLFLK